MAERAMRGAGAQDEFTRLHRLFVEHFSIALGLVWLTTVAAFVQVPWTRNLRGLLDPSAAPESTFSYLLTMPLLMTAGWVSVAFGGELIRRTVMLRNQRIEFAAAGLAVLAVFVLAVQRALSLVLVGA